MYIMYVNQALIICVNVLHQLFWDNEQQKCEWSNKVHCSGRTLVALSMESNLFCMEKLDGFYIDPLCKFNEICLFHRNLFE